MGIQDIPKSLQENKVWNEAYEEKHMVFAESNVVIANATVDLFLTLVPSFLHAFGKQVAYCLMDSRLRQVMGFPKRPIRILQISLEVVLSFRQLVIRHLCLPRFISARRTPTFDSVPLCPRFHVSERTYANGYETAKLGPAPAGKLMKECPRWKM